MRSIPEGGSSRKQIEEDSPLGVQAETVQLGQWFFGSARNFRTCKTFDRVKTMIVALSRCLTRPGLLGDEPKLIPIVEPSADNTARTMVGQNCSERNRE